MNKLSRLFNAPLEMIHLFGEVTLQLRKNDFIYAVSIHFGDEYVR